MVRFAPKMAAKELKPEEGERDAEGFDADRLGPRNRRRNAAVQKFDTRQLRQRSPPNLLACINNPQQSFIVFGRACLRLALVPVRLTPSTLTAGLSAGGPEMAKSLATFARRFRGLAPIGCAILFAIFAFYLGAALLPVEVAAEPGEPPPLDPVCHGPWNQKVLTQRQLDQIIAEHARYLASIPAPTGDRKGAYQPVYTQVPEGLTPGTSSPFPPSQHGEPVPVQDTGRADLCGARIKGLTFRGADLRFARLMGARIEQSDLSGVDLRWGYLERVGLSENKPTRESSSYSNNYLRKMNSSPARLYDVDMRGALMYDNDFSGWDFSGADIRFVDAARDDFARANFNTALFGGSTFRDIGMKDANLSMTSFSHNLISIMPGQMPLLATLRDASGLTSLHRNADTLSTLHEIREGLKQAGLPASMSQVDYAIDALPHKDSGTDFSAVRRFEDQGRAIFLGIPYAYGLKSERPILIGAIMIPLFGILYVYSIFEQKGTDPKGIWLNLRPIKESDKEHYTPTLLTYKNCNPYIIGMWYSILSAFRIGWRDLNVGDWIARLQTADYEYRATGWVRTVSGVQSLLSVYLITLVVASYISK
jgi:uncharacterized protein YjbI with pentapeptide repeats